MPRRRGSRTRPAPRRAWRASRTRSGRRIVARGRGRAGMRARASRPAAKESRVLRADETPTPPRRPRRRAVMNTATSRTRPSCGSRRRGRTAGTGGSRRRRDRDPDRERERPDDERERVRPRYRSGPYRPAAGVSRTRRSADEEQHAHERQPSICWRPRRSRRGTYHDRDAREHAAGERSSPATAPACSGYRRAPRRRAGS